MIVQKTIHDIFKDAINSKPIFKDKSVLTINFTPQNIMHRDSFIYTLSKILAVSLKGEKPSNVFIYGPTGTGKTLVTTFVLKELKKAADENGSNITYVYVNSNLKRVADTEYRLLSYIANELGENIPFTGLPTDVVYDRFFKKLKEIGGVVILAIDEIDILVEKIGDRFLYTLTRINQELEGVVVSLIGISNNLSFTEHLDARVKSSLSEEEIWFTPYNALQLRDILNERAKLAFNEGKISEAVINKCAALAAQEHGDARKALDLLRVAGEIAERLNAEKVLEEHVDMAEKKIDYDRIFEAVKTLPKHSNFVLYAIIDLLKENDNSKVLTGDVYNTYSEICKRNKIKPLTQRRVSDIISELDVLGIINAKVISHGRYGRTREITFSNSLDTYLKIKDFIKKEWLFND